MRAIITAGRAIANAASSYRNKRSRKRVRMTGPTRRRMPVELRNRRIREQAKAARDRMDMKKVKCFIAQRTAEHVKRSRRVGSCRAGVNLVSNCQINKDGTLDDIEASASALRFWNPATNALTTLDFASGTYSREACVSIYKKILLKNNYQVPCHIELWSGRPKDATNLTPHDCFTGGLADQGGISDTSPLVRLHDSRSVDDVWEMKLISKKILYPGEAITRKHYVTKFDYTFATNDQHALSYHRNQGGHVFYLRVYGTLGHDTTAAEYGRMEAGVDWEYTSTIVWEYDAGKDLKDYTIDDTSATSFTNSGVQGAKPIADNQPYSIA